MPILILQTSENKTEVIVFESVLNNYKTDVGTKAQ